MLSVTALFVFLTLSAAQNDPLEDFCRIHGHQTTVVDRKLYIDGGFVNWSPISAESQNYTSTWLRYGDLDEDHEGFPQHDTLPKEATVPSLDGGVLWSDTVNKIIYQYGGDYGNRQPEDFRLWFYDIIYDTWNTSNASTTDIRRASWGAGVAVQDRAKGYYYGGWLTNYSVPSYQSRTPLKNMIVYDIIDNSFKNRTGPDDIPRAEGVMVYVPAGDGGFLVYFGGIQFPYGNDTEAALPMTDILLYDVANERWYQQTASGEEIPGDRRRFCAGATWTEDRTSYNIYLFGGASVGDGVGYGDVWILSLPSFTWIKFFPVGEEAGPPHHSLSCDVIENSQMIIMGGTFPNYTDCDIPANYGQHGLDLGKANDEGAKWALFNPNNTVYQVPTEIAQVIGGGPTGGATALAPEGGWEHADLSILFERHYTPTVRTPTRYIPTPTAAPQPSNSTSPSGGPGKKTIIAGAVGGGVGGLLLIIAVVGICLCIRRRRRKAQASNTTVIPEAHPQSMDNFNSPPMSSHEVALQSQRSTQYTYTAQGSPAPPSDHAWSQYGFATPNQTASPTQFDKDGQVSSYHPRSPSHQSNNISLRSSAAGYYDQPPSPPAVMAQELPNAASPPAQEMPNARSPLGFTADQHPQPLYTPGVDPYFAQHPPRS